MRPQSPFKLSSSVSRPRTPAPADDVFNVSPSAKGKGKAVFIDVLVEGVEAETSYEVPPAAKKFLAGLGDVVQASSSSRSAQAGLSTPSRKETNPVALKNTLTELLTTERSYVRRIRTLYTAYTVPLKTSAKSIGRNPMGITAYEANSLFSNIEKIVALNESFLRDLENAVGRNDCSWADVLLQHLSGFDPYNVYVTNYPAAKEIERRLATNSTFQRFCENVQYSPTADIGNAGLRDLLAEPFQRIARYPLMINEMLRQLSPGDSIRTTLLRASAAAADIAHNQHDEVATRTEEMMALASSIVDFPRTLINGHRRFISTIDVKDVPPGQSSALHVSLFLFSDMLVIAKRPSGEKGKALAGLERSNTLLGSLSPLKGLSGGLQFKGAVRLYDMTAVDDGASFALHFEVPPQDVGARWSNRSSRRFFAETLDKRTFLAHLWKAQAQLHVHPGISTVLSTTMGKLAQSAALPVERDDAHVFFTIYNRAAYLDELEKGHTVLRLDGIGKAYEPLGFPIDRLKPQLIIDADCDGQEHWTMRSRKRGEAAEQRPRSLGHASLAYSVAQTALQAGMAEVPPRYSMHAHIAEPHSPMSPGKHRRTQSNASKASSQSQNGSLRESTAAAAFGSHSSIESDSRRSIEDSPVEELMTIKQSQSEEDLIASEKLVSPHLGRSTSGSAPAMPEEDVFGPTMPLSPRARTPLGPRPSPGQPRRKPVPIEQEEPIPEKHEKVMEVGTVDLDTPTTNASLKRQREDIEAPASPASTHIRKRVNPQAPIDYSPGVRSPLGRQPPRRAPSDRQESPGGLIRQIDAAIEDAAGRSESMTDLRKVVNTFVLPECQANTPKSTVARSGVGLHRRDSIPRSPKLESLAFTQEEKPKAAAAFDAFKAEVNDKLDALLGGWEQTTKQYQCLSDTYRSEKAIFAATLAARDGRIKELEAEAKELRGAHSQLNDEVQEIYNAVNRELDRIFEEVRADEGAHSLQQELKRKTADEVLLKFRIQQLEAQLAARR